MSKKRRPFFEKTNKIANFLAKLKKKIKKTQTKLKRKEETVKLMPQIKRSKDNQKQLYASSSQGYGFSCGRVWM